MAFKSELFTLQDLKMWAEEFESACATGLCQETDLTHTFPPSFFLDELTLRSTQFVAFAEPVVTCSIFTLYWEPKL